MYDVSRKAHHTLELTYCVGTCAADDSKINANIRSEASCSAMIMWIDNEVLRHRLAPFIVLRRPTRLTGLQHMTSIELSLKPTNCSTVGCREAFERGTMTFMQEIFNNRPKTIQSFIHHVYHQICSRPVSASVNHNAVVARECTLVYIP